MILVHRLGRGRPRQVCLVVLGSGLGGVSFPEAAWAHHPGSGPGGLSALLALVLFVLAFVVVWALSALLERRETARSKRVRSPKE